MRLAEPELDILLSYRRDGEKGRRIMETGTFRSDWARARIALLSMECGSDIPVDKFDIAYATGGYWDKLHYYGPDCWSNFALLSEYLTPEHRERLRSVLTDSDNGVEPQES